MMNKRIWAMLLALVMIFALAACGPKDGDTTKTDDPKTQETASPEDGDAEKTDAPEGEETEEPEDGGEEEPPATSGDNIFKFGGSGFDGVFNPIMSSNVYDGYVCDMVFEGLVQPNEKGEFVPFLADWELSEDKKTYTFTLKDGIQFSDGTPLTAEDVEFTYKTIADPQYTGPRGYAVAGFVGYEAFHAGDTEEFEGIKVVDEKTISFTFETAAVPNIESFQYGILSKDYYAFESFENDFETLNNAPMGSGPMVLVDYAPKQHILLDTNPEYWDQDNVPKIEGVLINEVDKDAILAALESGQIDHAQVDTNLDNYDALLAMDGLNATPFLGNGYTFMCFECTTPPFDQKEVRQAFMYALDRKEFIMAEYKSDELAMVGMAPISPVSWAFPEEGLNAYDFDLDKANELLDEAGWVMEDDGFRYKDGEKLAVTWLVYTEATWPGTLAGMAADSWKQIGCDLTIDLMDFNTVATKTMDTAPEERPNNFDIYTMGFSLSPDPDLKGALFDADAGEQGGFNASGFRDEHVQELIEKGRTTFDQDERKEIYAELATILNDEVATAIVAYRFELWASSKRVKNLDVNTYLKFPQFIREIELD